ncbi:MAG: 30S ribosomal protein S10 [Candidatus Diapherotrites archaeon]|nr:30S ribosomal protein S10 [Candidatus Diapherotrites archaeon]
MQVATIKLTGPDFKRLDSVCHEIKEICKKTGAKVSGPVPLPTKRLKVPIRKSPCGDGSETFEHWEMRIHKRLINVETNERTLRQVMRVKVPDQVMIEIELKE